MLKHTILVGLVLGTHAFAQCSACAKAYDDNMLLTFGVASQNATYGIKTQATNTLVLFSVLIYTDGTDGDVAIWSHDAAVNRPLKELATAVWSSSNSGVAWKGTNFARPVIIRASTTYWVVLRVTQFNAIPSLRARSTTGQTYAYSLNRGYTWTGPYNGYEWKYRLHCCPLSNLAGFAPFGSGCGPSATGTPAIGSSLAPLLGGSMDVSVTNARSSTAALLAFGASNSAWGASVLPLGLTPFGAPGCSILVSLDLLLSTATNGSGNGSVRLTIPKNAALLGFRVYNQWAVLDPSANPLSLALSAGARAEVGQ